MTLRIALALIAVIWFTEARADEAVHPNHEGTEIYTLHIVTTNGNLEPDSPIFATEEECEREGASRAGKIRSFTCVPGRGPHPGK
jgi:hypothetical protein